MEMTLTIVVKVVRYRHSESIFRYLVAFDLHGQWTTQNLIKWFNAKVNKNDFITCNLKSKININRITQRATRHSGSK